MVETVFIDAPGRCPHHVDTERFRSAIRVPQVKILRKIGVGANLAKVAMPVFGSGFQDVVVGQPRPAGRNFNRGICRTFSFFLLLTVLFPEFLFAVSIIPIKFEQNFPNTR